MTLYEIVKSLQSAQGSIAKQAILDANKDNALFKAYMKATYDVGINYYQKKLPKGIVPGKNEFELCDIEFMQEELASRSITGGFAIAGLKVRANHLNVEGQNLLTYMLDHSIGASVGDTMVLKTWPDLYFIPPYQRCSLLDKKTREKFSDGKPFYVQTKCDGSFAYIVKWPDGKAEVITRQGSKYPQEFADMMATGLKPGMVVVGELEVYNTGKACNVGLDELLDRKTGNGLLNSVLKDGTLDDTYEVRCTAWDLLTTDEFTAGKSTRTYQDRYEHFKDHEIYHVGAQIVLVKTWVVNTLEDAFTIYRDHTSRGLEGCVIKQMGSLWKNGTSKDNLKMKLKFQVEMRCVGIYEGEGKAAGMMGGANLESEDGEITNGCGTGFSDKQRKEFWNDPSSIVGKVVAVEANDITQDRDVRKKASLSLPVFIEVVGKTKADTKAEIVAQWEAAKLGG